MADRSATITEDWIAALRQSLALFGTLVVDSQVRAAWSDDGSLPGYTVGGIAGHVLSLMVGLQLRIEAQDTDVETIPYAQWYGAALSSTERHTALIEMGEEFAAGGPARVAAHIEATNEQLVRRLRGAKSDLVIPLASLSGVGVRLDNFLMTRFVEITVHGHDIAVSVGLDTPAFPAKAWELAAIVISETTSQEGANAEFVLAVSRPGTR